MEGLIDFGFKFILFAIIVWFVCAVRTECIVSHVSFDKKSCMWAYSLRAMPTGTPYRVMSGVFLPNPPDEFLKIPLLRPIFMHDLDTLDFISLCAALHYLCLLVTATSGIVFLYGHLLASGFILMYVFVFFYNILRTKTKELDLVEILPEGYVLAMEDQSQIYLDGTPPDIKASKVLCGKLPSQKTWFEITNKSKALLLGLEGAFYWSGVLALVYLLQLIIISRGTV